MKNANRLAGASSPYLLQHAYNPVDWYEWGPEALQRAQTEDKPILVSIGYSSCHWCHVMERESFENEDLAAIMNANFICIKVDREERPDVDHIYMDAVQVMGGQGGWPLNVFLTPDQVPFYGGTYFPPHQWGRVLLSLARAFRERRPEIDQSAAELRKFLQEASDLTMGGSSAPADEKLSESMVNGIVEKYDTENGGRLGAPKFPMPSIWQFLLRVGASRSDQHLTDRVMHTLTKMACGGIYDQVGGGFARYSVDDRWFAPHFEKMLYDNGQLMSLYAEGFQYSKNPLFRSVLEQTADWLLREMKHPEGGFYSALDADSEGEEGKFYCWTWDELRAALGTESDVYAAQMSCSPGGNWEHGRNILLAPSLADRPAGWRAAMQKLLGVRSLRVRPALDDKIITAWNGMTISGLVKAGLALGRPDLIGEAEQCFRFLQSKLTDEARIFRSFRKTRSDTEGFLDDYAFYIAAAIDLYDATLEEGFYLEAERRLAYVLSAFTDESSPMLFYSSVHAAGLIARKKEQLDNVIPSSNAVMATVLMRMSALSGRREWQDRATKMLAAAHGLMRESPSYMCGWGMALAEQMQSFTTVVISGSDIRQAREGFGSWFLPFTLFAGSTSGLGSVPVSTEKKSVGGRTTFYVCRDFTCLPPVFSADEVLRLMHHSS